MYESLSKKELNELKDFHKNKETRDLNLAEENKLPVGELYNGNLFSVDDSLLFVYSIVEDGKSFLSDEKRETSLSKEFLRELILSEQKALNNLFAINLNLEEIDIDFEELIKRHFLSENFIRNFVIDRINEAVETEQDTLIKDWFRFKKLSPEGEFLIQECFLNNIERSFKKLKQTLSLDYLASVRSDQSRLHFSSDKISDLNSLIDDFIQLEINNDKSINTFLNYWLSYFGIGNNLFLETASSGSIKALLIHKDNRSINIADLGFGASQIIPILLRIAITAYNHSELYSSNYSPSTICIEEPESNLHPALQSKLADLFIDAADKFNIQFIIETHSEYLIRKMQYWTAKAIIKPDATTIYYFFDPQNIPSEEQQVKQIKIKEDGSLSDDFGSGFFDEADKIAISIWNMQNSQKN
jgi:hypothetical protein